MCRGVTGGCGVDEGGVRRRLVEEFDHLSFVWTPKENRD